MCFKTTSVVSPTSHLKITLFLVFQILHAVTSQIEFFNYFVLQKVHNSLNFMLKIYNIHLKTFCQIFLARHHEKKKR